MKDFFKTSVLGGLAVVTPIAILCFIFVWLYNTIADLIRPLTDWAMANVIDHSLVANIAVLASIGAACFLIGFLVKTRVGKLLHSLLDRILKFAPFYKIIKETVGQFTGNKKSPFSSVALVDLFGNGTLVTAFVTDDTDVDQKYLQRVIDTIKYITIFIPTAPNPTSGLIYHVPEDRVTMIDAPVEDTMKSILSCGAGSKILLQQL